MTPREALEAYCDAFVRADLAALRALFTEDAIFENPLIDRTPRGREAVLREIAVATEGLRNMRVELEHVLEGEDDVFAEGLFFGEMIGAGTEVDGTPVRADFRFAVIVELRDGKIGRLAEFINTKPLKPWARARTFPTMKRSPYYDGAVAAGMSEFMAYNHCVFPMIYSRPPAEDYAALTERVTLWDVGCERQTEVRGPDALRFSSWLATRDLSELKVGMCRYAYVCDPEGAIICDPVILHPFENVVWFSHGDVDLTLWARGAALNSGFEVEIREPDVAPLQVQGPLAPDVLRPITEHPIDELGFYRCVATKVAGTDAVVSRTGWSGGLGFEIYPLASDRAMALWDALLAAGEPHQMLVTGPIVERAVERNVTDTSYPTNGSMNPFEAGGERLVELDRHEFIGRTALRKIAAEGPKRKTVGLLIDGDLPRFEWHWDLVDARGRPGTVRWAVHSFTLGRSIGIALVDADVALEEAVQITTPLGRRRAKVTRLPFVDR